DGPGAAEATALISAEAGRAWVVGITGVPGSGKSTLVDALLGAWLERGLAVAVIAIDPSSPISGGAVLGDRIRMGAHSAHANAFIRSFSARGELGGLSRAASAAVDCFDAAGFERVIVETVGTGQSETSIVEIADTRVVVCPPGLGDDVQAIKAGTLEIADLLAVSKGDVPLAEQTAREMREMLTLRRKQADAVWKPRVIVVSAKANTGIAELLAALEDHRAAAGHGRRRKAPAAADAPARDRASSAPERYAKTAEATDAADDTVLARLASFVERDGVCSTFGITLLSGAAGRAEVVMTVDTRHLNFNGACHGGAIFALADTAFGLASNSHGPVAAGIDAHITFQAAVRLGDTLVARAVEVTRSRRLAVYRIDVARPCAGGPETAVSTFTGTVYLKG
ncbi:MAG: methylmalonyl Co-A mutase-associated GTPase MeaB, partial [Pseudomonadota bacterium]|nr:methylmalonyl Co-A mutase-associated GTPase MeaB [Pseudomonadota bacterium]